MRERLLAAEKVTAIDWRDGTLYLLDQRLLPLEECWCAYGDAAGVAEAIRQGVVRGAAAIGIAAAYGLLLGARQRLGEGGDWRAALAQDFALFASACPASGSLAWALGCMRERLERLAPGESPLPALEAEARGLQQSDREANLAMAQFGVEMIRQHRAGQVQSLLTHGNAGALAGGGFGSALGVIRGAWLDGLVERVHVDESRPSLQGARLSAWELAREGLPVFLNADTAVAHLMKSEAITWVVVGAERIAANGDVVACIGTYQLAINAMHHGVRFMVVAPSSAIDLGLENGDDLVLDEYPASTLLAFDGRPLAAPVEVINPVFDITPADLLDVIVTERGVLERPDAAGVARLLSRKRLH